MKRKQCNKNVFKNIKTEEEAYWLGFLLADGCNLDNKNIRIDIKDSGHLEKLSELLYPGENKPILKRDLGFGTVYYFSCSIIEIVENLVNYGLVPRKSKIVELPNLPKCLYKHFIRGVFDGDGSLSFVLDKNYRRYNFNIVGSEALMLGIKNILIENVGVSIGYGKMKTIFRIHKKGNQQILQLLSWLYTDATIFLQRKFDKYQEMINYYKEKNN